MGESATGGGRNGRESRGNQRPARTRASVTRSWWTS